MRSRRCIHECLGRTLDIFVLLALLTSCILISLNVTGPGRRLLDVDVYVPKSFKPFHNAGSRIGLHTEWSLTTVKIHNIITDKLDEVIKIDDLARLYDNLTTSVDIIPDDVPFKLPDPLTTCEDEADVDCNPTLQIIKTIQRSAHIVRSSFTVTLYAFGLATVLYIIFLSSKREATLRSVAFQDKEYATEHTLRLPLCSASAEAYLSAKKSRRTNLSMICYRVSVILGMLGCLGLCMTLITHYDDILGNVEKILPMLIRKLSWICLTHNSEECRIVYTVRPQAFEIVGILTAVFVTSLATTALRF